MNKINVFFYKSNHKLIFAFHMKEMVFVMSVKMDLYYTSRNAIDITPYKIVNKFNTHRKDFVYYVKKDIIMIIRKTNVFNSLKSMTKTV